MTKLNSPIFSLVLLMILAGCSAKRQTAEKVLFTPEIAGDATPAVLARILEAGEKPISEIRFEPGEYHFYPDKALEFFVHISNHNDEVTRTAFPLNGFKNLVIDGQGARFIFHGRMIPFLIDNCENITVQNVSVDWAQPFHSEALVVANDNKNKTFDLKISDEYPYEIRNGQIYFIKEYYEHTIGQAILFDPRRKAVAFDTESYTPLTSFKNGAIQNNVDRIVYKYGIDPRAPEQAKIGRQNRLQVEQLKPGLVRVFNHGKKIPPVGTILVCKGNQWENRLAPAFRINYTKKFYAKNVNVHHAGGMGLIAENSADLVLDAFNVTPSHGRLVSTTADATHFVGCRGKVVLKNCIFHNQLDDASNIHGTYQRIVDVLDENTLGVRMGHFQQQGFTIGVPGDTIGFVNLENSFFPYQKLTIKSTQYINGRYQKITFNEAIPDEVKPGHLIENLDAYPEVLVQNCDISRNRARGLLLSSPRKTVVENNFFSTEMEALLIPVESGHWYESGSVTQLIVRNNVFQDCNHSGFNRGVIRFVPDDENHNIAFWNISIENNKFNQFDNLILEIKNTQNLVFKENTITNSETFPMLFPDNPAIIVERSRAIVFENNNYSGRAKKVLQTDNSVPGLVFK